jgi:hypothetical protein
VLAEHPAFGESLEQLRGWGVHIMDQLPQAQRDRLPAWEDIFTVVTELVEGNRS